MAWYMGTDGYPTNSYLQDVSQPPITKPVPNSMWSCEDGNYPKNGFLQPIVGNSVNKPYPNAMWGIKEDYPACGFHNPIPMLGAFGHSTSLKSIKIPKTVKSIGPNTFTYSNIQNVTISEDCVYEDTTFPPGCTIKFYNS